MMASTMQGRHEQSAMGMANRTRGVAQEVTCRVLLISGSIRKDSTNSAVLRTAARIGPTGIDGVIYENLARLPHFNPDDEGERLPAEPRRLRAAIRGAAALMFSTPEYAGALPGSFKNLLDWTIGDEQRGSIYNKPVAWITASPRGASGAYAELRTVLGYAQADIVEAACLDVPVTSAMVDAGGLINDRVIRSRIADGLRALAAHAGCRPVRDPTPDDPELA
jgi:chromate reductase, NAD(P)H dehydrogenase (quinone)